MLGVWRDTYPTRCDETENEMRFLDFSLKSSTMNGKIVFYSTEKHKIQKNGAFWNELVLYEIKLIF